MNLFNLTFSRNALAVSFAGVVASWVGANVLPVMSERGGWYAAAAFVAVHLWNFGYQWWRESQ